MSFIVNGKPVVDLLDSLVSDYKPNPIHNKHMLFADNKGNICFKIEELDEQPSLPLKILGKRKLEVAFGEDFCDEERYGQVVGDNFFENNMGHGVAQEVAQEKKIFARK